MPSKGCVCKNDVYKKYVWISQNLMKNSLKILSFKQVFTEFLCLVVFFSGTFVGSDSLFLSGKSEKLNVLITNMFLVKNKN